MSQYLKPDSELGYVEDSALIEFLQFNNLRHSILGCMLGDFNEVGNYVVAPEIVEELISMEKYVVQTYDNIELCRSVLKLDKQISFMVTFEGNRATLSLVEKLNYEANFKLNSGTYSNINEYVLDSVETSGEVNRNVIYDRWNIKLIPGEMIDIFNCDDSILEKYFGIVNRFKYLLEANKQLLQHEEELEEVESSYSNELLDMLKHYPKLEKAVMQTIKETLEEKKGAISVEKPFFAKAFNEILENAIEKNITVLEETEQKEFIQEKRNATLNVNIKREDCIDIVHVEDIQEKNETSPKIPQLKMPPSYESKTVTEHGAELVIVNKEVVENLTGEKEENIEFDLIQRTILAIGEKKGVDVVLPEKPIEEKQETHESEKDKLMATLIGAGLGVVIGGTAGAVVGAVAGAAVAEIADQVINKPQQQDEKKAKKISPPAPPRTNNVKKSTSETSVTIKKQNTENKQNPKEQTVKETPKKQTTENKTISRIHSVSSVNESEVVEEINTDLRIKKDHEIGVGQHFEIDVNKDTAIVDKANTNTDNRLMKGETVLPVTDLSEFDELVGGVGAVDIINLKTEEKLLVEEELVEEELMDEELHLGLN